MAISLAGKIRPECTMEAANTDGLLHRKAAKQGQKQRQDKAEAVARHRQGETTQKPLEATTNPTTGVASVAPGYNIYIYIYILVNK